MQPERGIGNGQRAAGAPQGADVTVHGRGCCAGCACFLGPSGVDIVPESFDTAAPVRINCRERDGVNS